LADYKVLPESVSAYSENVIRRNLWEWLNSSDTRILMKNIRLLHAAGQTILTLTNQCFPWIPEYIIKKIKRTRVDPGYLKSQADTKFLN